MFELTEFNLCVKKNETGWIRRGEVYDIWSGSHCRISSLTEHNEVDVDVMKEITNGTLIVLDDEVNSWWSKHWKKRNPKLEHYKAPVTFDSKITFSSNKLLFLSFVLTTLLLPKTTLLLPYSV